MNRYSFAELIILLTLLCAVYVAGLQVNRNSFDASISSKEAINTQLKAEIANFEKAEKIGASELICEFKKLADRYSAISDRIMLKVDDSEVVELNKANSKLVEANSKLNAEVDNLKKNLEKYSINGEDFNLYERQTYDVLGNAFSVSLVRVVGSLAVVNVRRGDVMSGDVTIGVGYVIPYDDNVIHCDVKLNELTYTKGFFKKYCSPKFQNK